MLENEKNQSNRLNIVLDNLENNFIDDYEFWKKLVDDINIGINNFNPNTPGFTYNEFCQTFKNELEMHSDINQNIDLSTIHNTVKQIMFSKISKKSL